MVLIKIKVKHIKINNMKNKRNILKYLDKIFI